MFQILLIELEVLVSERTRDHKLYVQLEKASHELLVRAGEDREALLVGEPDGRWQNGTSDWFSQPPGKEVPELRLLTYTF